MVVDALSYPKSALMSCESLEIPCGLLSFGFPLNGLKPSDEGADVICVVVRTEMLVVVRAVAVGVLIIVSPQLGV